MRQRILVFLACVLTLVCGYVLGNRRPSVAYANAPDQGTVPKSYGRLVTAISDSIGTGLVFEDADGTIRFVSITGMKEGELPRYDKTPSHGGIPKSFGRLVTAVVTPTGTGLVFEDSNGAIRFVTMAGVTEKELDRD